MIGRSLAHYRPAWDDAEAHFEHALQQADEMPHRVEQPEVRRWCARMLLDRGDPGDRERARTLLTEARAAYEEIGMRSTSRWWTR